MKIYFATTVLGDRSSVVGARSLQVYLIHEFFVALIFAGVASTGLSLSPLVTLIVIAGLAAVVTIALSLINAKFGPRWLFATPRWLTRQLFRPKFQTTAKPT